MKKLLLLLAIAMPLSTAAFAQDLPKIAVYVTGGREVNENKALMTLTLEALVKSGRYVAVERFDDFVAQINREQATQRSGAVDDSQIRRAGVQAGVQYVCVADVSYALNSALISARIIDVETAHVAAMSSAQSRMRSIHDIRIVSNKIVQDMLNMIPRTTAKPTPVAPPPAKPEPVAAKPIKPEPAAPEPAAEPEPEAKLEPEPESKPEEKQAMAIPEPIIPAPEPTTPASPPAMPHKPTLKPARWAAIGLDMLGAGMIVYGVIENSNVRPYKNKAEYDKVASSAKTRNIVYGLGTAALLGGVSIHMFF